jgi:hypothetical protein
VDFLEELSTVLFRYASHEDARWAFPVELVPDHCVALAATLDSLGFRAIFREFVVQEVSEVWGGPLRVKRQYVSLGLLTG